MKNQFRGLALRMWPMLLTISLRVQTGNKFISLKSLNRQRTYGKLSWSREVKRTTSLNQRHAMRFDDFVWCLTIMEASARAV